MCWERCEAGQSYQSYNKARYTCVINLNYAVAGTQPGSDLISGKYEVGIAATTPSQMNDVNINWDGEFTL
jgi:hypothetical protein